MIAAVALAAGAARRFGGGKQLHPVAGRPMLEHVLAALERAPLDERLVVLGDRADAILAAVPLHGARPVRCARWRDGQAASLRCGLDALSAGAEAAVVVLGVGPHLAPEAIVRVVSAWRAGDRERLHAADYGAGRSHPVLIPRGAFPALPASGERPGRALAAVAVDCGDLPPPGDVDYR